MNRLYWRIFLAFWLVIILTIVVTVTVNSISLRSEVADTHFATLSGSLDALAEQAQSRLQASGRTGLTAWLREQQHVAPLQRLLILDADGRDLLDRPIPAGVVRMARFGARINDRNAPRVGPLMEPGMESRKDPGKNDKPRRRRFPAISRMLTGPDGAQYVLFLPSLGPRAGPWFGSPFSRSIFPLALVLISGIVCLLLARYLSRPIRAFRSAGQRIARGDLGARIGTDLTQRKDEFGALARDFDDMAARIEALVDGHRRLLRDVSHELRSPLARLNTAVALIRQRDDKATVETNLQRIESESGKLDALIGRILRFAQLEAQTSVARKEIDLVEIIDGIIDDARFEARVRDCVIEFESPEALKACVEPILIHSAIENIVRNAVQHCHHVISITVRPDANGTMVCIEIVDDGEGLTNAADVERLFEPFFTASSRATSGGSGAGIGLAIAHRAIELHGGTIRAGNATGGGFVVSIELPLQVGS